MQVWRNFFFFYAKKESVLEKIVLLRQNRLESCETACMNRLESCENRCKSTRHIQKLMQKSGWRLIFLSGSLSSQTDITFLKFPAFTFFFILELPKKKFIQTYDFVICSR